MVLRFDFLAGSSLAAPILVGAVLELPARGFCASYAAVSAPVPPVIGAVLVDFAA